MPIIGDLIYAKPLDHVDHAYIYNHDNLEFNWDRFIINGKTFKHDPIKDCYYLVHEEESTTPTTNPPPSMFKRIKYLLNLENAIAYIWEELRGHFLDIILKVKAVDDSIEKKIDSTYENISEANTSIIAMLAESKKSEEAIRQQIKEKLFYSLEKMNLNNGWDKQAIRAMLESI